MKFQIQIVINLLSRYTIRTCSAFNTLKMKGQGWGWGWGLLIGQEQNIQKTQNCSKKIAYLPSQTVRDAIYTCLWACLFLENDPFQTVQCL